MDKKLIIANWKCNPPTLKEAEHLLGAIERGIKGLKKSQVIICPPFLWFVLFQGLPSKFEGCPQNLRAALGIGAQDCHWENKGTFTGAVSPTMLKDLGCQYVIIGHSERRKYFGETDEIINLKLKAALKNRLIPILCVGEKERESENELDLIVGEQLEKDLSGISAARVSEIIFTYEPVWAISPGIVGSGNPCSPEDAMKAGLFIRSKIAKRYNRKIADKIKVIYGGSVISKNVVSYVQEMGIGGVLVGGASLNASDFIKLAENVEKM